MPRKRTAFPLPFKHNIRGNGKEASIWLTQRRKRGAEGLLNTYIYIHTHYMHTPCTKRKKERNGERDRQTREEERERVSRVTITGHAAYSPPVSFIVSKLLCVGFVTLKRGSGSGQAPFRSLAEWIRSFALVRSWF